MYNVTNNFHGIANKGYSLNIFINQNETVSTKMFFKVDKTFFLSTKSAY